MNFIPGLINFSFRSVRPWAIRNAQCQKSAAFQENTGDSIAVNHQKHSARLMGV